MRAAYLGPPGTNSHAALVAAGVEAEPVALPTRGRRAGRDAGR